LNRSVSLSLLPSMTVSLSISGSPAQLRLVDRILSILSRSATPLAWALALLVLLSRDPYRLLDAQLWAEDGPLWIYDAYTTGLSSLLTPHTGYLQTFPRLVGFSTDIAPLAWVPTIFAIAGFATQLAPACLMLSSRGRALIPNLAARLLLVGFYLGVPNSFETFVNITNAQWHVAIIMALIMLMAPPRHRAWRIVEYVYLAIGGLSGPFSFILAPLSCWQAWREHALRGPRGVHAVLLTVTALIQAGFVIASAGSERHLQPLGASFAGLARILVGQVFLAGMAGAGEMTRFETTAIWRNNLFVEALLVIFLAIMGFAVLKGPRAFRLFAVFAALVLASALVSPVISTTQPQWDALELPGAGSRYYLLPILAWFAALLVLSGQPAPWCRWSARILVILCLVGVRTDWHYPRQPETQFGAAAAIFAAAPPGTNVIFREAPNPAVWLFSLTKK
jgi:hypothetical protein